MMLQDNLWTSNDSSIDQSWKFLIRHGTMLYVIVISFQR